MEAWERWWNMAQDSLVAAQSLERLGLLRSCASRTYYAAYQAVTALLLYARQVPPAGREAWSHEATPALLRSVSDKVLVRPIQRDLEERLKSLYDLRLIADYQGVEDVEIKQLRAAVRSATFIIKEINDLLPGN